MIVGLSCVSSRGLWILCDDDATQLVANTQWSDSESAELSQGIIPNFESLLVKASCKKSSIKKIFVVSGPGAFTGLRVSAAFAQGLARALDVPVFGIPTFELFGQSVQIPLQHQKQKHLTLSEIVEQKQEILLLSAAGQAHVEMAQPQFLAKGFKESPLWPTPDEFFAAIQKNKSTPSQDFEIDYGLNPKISGQR